jgi:glucose/arabinose dehydrogenase
VIRLRLIAALVTAAGLAAAAPASADLKLVPAFSGSVSLPMYVTSPPGDSHRLFVVTRPGYIYVAVDGVLQTTPFLDLHNTVWSSSGEAAMGSMAFDPGFSNPLSPGYGRFYVYYVAKPTGSQVNGPIHIDRFTMDDPASNVADPATAATLLEIPHNSNSNHYGAQIAFGPDGKLYAGTGDGGGAYDPNGNAQNPASQLGKLLVLDTNATPVTVATAALGLRNPYRFSFDRTTGDLVLGDVGQATWEEIDWVPATDTLPGSNFGWDCWEGNTQLIAGCNPTNYVPPVLTYANPNGDSPPNTAVTGGVVVRDPALTTLFGRYLYADFFAGQIHSAALAKPVTDDREEDGLPVVSQLVAFGQDADAHVYVVSLAGSVQRIVCDGSCDSPSGGGGSQTPPAAGPVQPGPTPGPGESQPAPGESQPPAPSPPDTSAPVLHIRAARTQDILRRHVVRFSLECSEACVVRATGKTRGASASTFTLRGVLERLPARKRVVLELRVSARIRRALRHRGSIAITLRGRDTAENLRTSRLVVGVKRP